MGVFAFGCASASLPMVRIEMLLQAALLITVLIAYEKAHAYIV